MPILRGPLYDDLVGALQRVPEIAGRTLTLTALSGGITNRNFRVDAAGTDDRWVIRLAGNDTHLLGISREVEHAATVAAAGVGVGPEVTAFIRPEGYLVTRFIVGSPVSDEAVHRPDTLRRVADSLRRIHDGPAIPGLFVPLRIVEAYRALAMARGVAIPPEYDLAAAVGRRIEGALLAAPIELRPCHNDLLNANFIDDGTRIRIIDWEYAGMGDPFFDLGNFSINHELTLDEDEILLAAYDGAVRPDRLARLTLMRIVSDFREAMWGVLQQGVSTLDVDFVAYAAGNFDRLLRNASGLRFEMPCARWRYPDGVTDPSPTPRLDRSDPWRSADLVFAATLILLFGALNLVRRSDGEGRAPRASGAAPSGAVVQPTPTRPTAAPGARASAGPHGSGASALAAGRSRPRRSRRHRDMWRRRRQRHGRLDRGHPGQRLHGRRQRLRERLSRPVPRLLRADLGTVPRPDATGARESRLGDEGPCRLSRVLRVGSRAERDELVLVRARGVARHRPRLRLFEGRWLRTPIRRRVAGWPPISRHRRPRCTLAIWHHPGSAPGSTATTTDVAPFWRALYDAGADLIVNGHDHDYERFAPQDPNGNADSGRGIREFVVGTGGADLRRFRDDPANSELRASVVAGRHPARPRMRRRTPGSSSRRRATSGTPGTRPATDVSCRSMSADQARVVVIGGGITGCSVAYHLALAGWTRRPARREGGR